jgi:hypothetical protein
MTHVSHGLETSDSKYQRVRKRTLVFVNSRVYFQPVEIEGTGRHATPRTLSEARIVPVMKSAYVNCLTASHGG